MPLLCVPVCSDITSNAEELSILQADCRRRNTAVSQHTARRAANAVYSSTAVAQHEGGGRGTTERRAVQLHGGS